jgi:hypothetical protein
MNVKFLHPRDSRVFAAEVDNNTTVSTCVDNLVSVNFMEPAAAGRPYAMVVQRTQRQALLPMTMQEVGVIDNDSLAILQMERGAKA